MSAKIPWSPPRRTGGLRLAPVPSRLDVVAAVAVFLVGVIVRPHHGAQTFHLDALAVVLLAVACVALALARSQPVAVWLVTLLIGIAGIVVDDVLSILQVPAIVALVLLALRRPLRTTVPAAVVTVLVCDLEAIGLSGSWLSTASTLTAWIVALAAGAAVVRAQQEALRAAHERARQAEATRESEVQRRVAEERLRIARELHDVVAHHASVISVQSGVARHLLATRPEAAAGALDAVREASRTVIGEMGQLVGLLRTGEDGLPTEPAPGLARLDELLETARAAGLALEVEVVGSATEVGPAADLIAYRVVQEAITNALKHGTGTAQLRITYEATSLAVDVRNPVADESTDAPPASGYGLLGMRDRIAAVGGRLRTGRDSHGRFLVHATIPREPA